MNKCKCLLLALMAVMALSSFAAPKEKKSKGDVPKRVYMCGVSIDFNDSVVYVTDLQHLDSMLIGKDGSLQNYTLYSIQLQAYLEGTLGEDGQTCAVIYSYKKSKIEKRIAKMRKKFQASGNSFLIRISAESFAFRKE